MRYELTIQSKISTTLGDMDNAESLIQLVKMQTAVGDAEHNLRTAARAWEDAMRKAMPGMEIVVNVHLY